ncbi:UAA transporter [Vararia minispora EC-137]|uniref:UAA transporter n=1 Tax=Vararia minispora EC-137 TaxID=1314806 RepID=A0ACB8QAQ4_9AGAM|nr:UAA transporter [Vararia minispora EC-137]
MGRRRIPGGSSRNHIRANGTQTTGRKELGKDTFPPALVTASLLDDALIVSVVFGGCCSNVWAYEQLLRMEPLIGPALTFSQMLFITLQKLPSFLEWRTGLLPGLQARKIPVREWLAQVLVFASGSLLNNLVYAYDVPLTVQIVFRSAGLPVSMVFGRLLMGRRYTPTQIYAVAFVTTGVVLATLSRPSAPNVATVPDPARYATGVALLTASLILTGVLGLLQERTYKHYGPHWQEGVFYTHALSLPMFVFMIPQIRFGLRSFALVDGADQNKSSPLVAYLILAGNLLSQLVCVSGVNRLSSRASSVSTQVVLTARKALSLCVSVWWFRNGWNAQLAIGACMVFLGSMWYALSSSATPQHLRHLEGKKRI